MSGGWVNSLHQNWWQIGNNHRLVKWVEAGIGNTQCSVVISGIGNAHSLVEISLGTCIWGTGLSGFKMLFKIMNNEWHNSQNAIVVFCLRDKWIGSGYFFLFYYTLQPGQPSATHGLFRPFRWLAKYKFSNYSSPNCFRK